MVYLSFSLVYCISILHELIGRGYLPLIMVNKVRDVVSSGFQIWRGMHWSNPNSWLERKVPLGEMKSSYSVMKKQLIAVCPFMQSYGLFAFIKLKYYIHTLAQQLFFVSCGFWLEINQCRMQYFCLLLFSFFFCIRLWGIKFDMVIPHADFIK